MEFAGGRYSVKERIGQGGEGEVFVVTDRLMPGVDLALKLLHAESKPELERFLRGEFQVLSTLSHPRLARVHDLGRDRDHTGKRRLYYTREYLSGEPLSIPDAGIPPRQALHTVLQILRALRPLHRMGLVHGDLKPANVIVSEEGETRLIDFAIAGTLSRGAETLPTGTVTYMSPEMIQGRVPDARGDLYSLGVLLVHLCTGRPPFQGSASDVIASHLNRDVEFPASFAWRRSGELARSTLETLLARLSAREPSLRFPSLDEAEAALMQALGHDDEDPYARRAPLGGMRPRARQRTHVLERMQALLSERGIGASLLVLGDPGAGRTGFLRSLRWELQLDDRLVLELDASRESTDEEQIRAVLRQLMWHARSLGLDVDPALQAASDEPTLRLTRKLESQMGALARAVAAHGPVVVMVDDLHCVHARALTQLRTLLGGLGNTSPWCVVATTTVDQAMSLPSLAEGPCEEVILARLDDEDIGSMVRSVVGRDDARLVSRLLSLSGGNPSLVAHFIERAARDDPRLDGVEDEPIPDRFRRLWRVRMQGVEGEALELLRALAVHGRAAPSQWLASVVGLDDPSRVLGDLVHLGLVRMQADATASLSATALASSIREQMSRERLVGVHRAWRRALMKVGAPEHLVLWHAIRSGDLHQAAEKAVAATRRLRALGDLTESARLLETVEAALGADHPDTSLVLATRAEILVQMGRPREALDLLDGMDGEDGFATLVRARALAATGRREESVRRLSGARADNRSDGQVGFRIIRELALQLSHLGRFEQAHDVIRQGLDHSGDVDDVHRADLICTRAQCFLAQEQLEDALADATEAIRMARRAHDGRLHVRARWILAMIHQRRGDLHQASACYRQAVDICRKTDDTGNLAMLQLNLGTLLHRIGEFEEALDRYMGAIDYARAAGRVIQAVQARINIGFLLAWLGQHERARLMARWSVAEAQRIGQEDLLARAHGLAGEVGYRTGDVSGALEKWGRALEIHDSIQSGWEASELRLEMVQALVQCDPPRTREARDLLDRAEEFLDKDSSALLGVKRGLTRAHLYVASGEGEKAVEEARRALAECSRLSGEWDDYSWQCFEVMARAHRSRGSDLLCARSLRRAADALEEASLRVPARFEEGFASQPARKRVFEEAARLEDPEPVPAHSSTGGGRMESTSAVLWRDTLMRLMELNRRLATTRDPDTLVDVILDSAVEFTGAERGLLLMPDDSRDLAVASARDFYRVSDSDAHMDFSTSIARQVQASGEAVITVSAMEDDRFGHARSVHELKLQSILCLPIKGRSEILGVLYLENRLKQGKFSDADRDLLVAFCDQLAITMETARLIEVSRKQRRELEKLGQERARLLDERTRELKAARRDLEEARLRLGGKTVFRNLVGSTPQMRKVFAIIERVGENDVPVVITGESGTGKEMVAHAIHEGESRRTGPFVAVNCGALPSELLESELFGHVRGAFTGAVRDKKGVFALASSGTLLLDEVGDMSEKMQLDLLRVLQENVVRPVGSEKEVQVQARVLAATQRPLEQLVQQGRFREDLFYRMSVVQIRIPPLRERKDDIALLVDHFLGAFALRYGTEKKSISRRAVKMLVEHQWPGNVRQLEHALLNAWVLSDAKVLDTDDFEILDSADVHAPGPGVGTGIEDGIHEQEKHAILDALKQARWNKTEAARILGMPRRTFYRRLRKYGLLK